MDKYIVNQDYRKYTKEDKEVWETLFIKQVKNLDDGDKAIMEFWVGLKNLGIGTSIPKFKTINNRLRSCNSDFQIVGVEGIVDDPVFFEMLSNGLFPVTTWIRSKDSIDYIEQPDMFHDLFGHVPLLINRNYTKYLKKIANHAIEIFKTDDKERQHMMSRLYWYTIEFGLTKLNGRYKIHGAGILSSYEESIKAVSPESVKKQFSKETLSERFEKDDLQEFYPYIHKNIKFLNKLRIDEI
jgi:phenylalanine-4-hydroxylase